MPAFIGGRAKGDELEVSAKSLPDIVGRMVCATEARARRVLVQHHDLTSAKSLLLRLRQPLQREVVLSERRHQQPTIRPQHAQAIPHPRMLQLNGEMREDGERIDEVESRVGIRERRREVVHGDNRKRQVRVAPLHHPGIDVAAEHTRVG